MKIIRIYEDNHGIIGVATNIFSAITYLINMEWLSEDFEVWSKEKKEYVQLKTIYSIDELIKLSITDFNTLFEGCFYLKQDTLIDYGAME